MNAYRLLLWPLVLIKAWSFPLILMPHKPRYILYQFYIFHIISSSCGLLQLDCKALSTASHRPLNQFSNIFSPCWGHAGQVLFNDCSRAVNSAMVSGDDIWSLWLLARTHTHKQRLKVCENLCTEPTMGISVLPHRLSLFWFQAFYQILEPGSRYRLYSVSNSLRCGWS